MEDKERLLWEQLTTIQRNRIDDLLERLHTMETALDLAWEIAKISMEQGGIRVMDLNEFFSLIERAVEEEDR